MANYQVYGRLSSKLKTKQPLSELAKRAAPLYILSMLTGIGQSHLIVSRLKLESIREDHAKWLSIFIAKYQVYALKRLTTENKKQIITMAIIKRQFMLLPHPYKLS